MDPDHAPVPGNGTPTNATRAANSWSFQAAALLRDRSNSQSKNFFTRGLCCDPHFARGSNPRRMSGTGTILPRMARTKTSTGSSLRIRMLQHNHSWHTPSGTWLDCDDRHKTCPDNESKAWLYEPDRDCSSEFNHRQGSEQEWHEPVRKLPSCCIHQLLSCACMDRGAGPANCQQPQSEEANATEGGCAGGLPWPKSRTIALLGCPYHTGQ